MSSRRRAWMSWSSGKDSAFALHVARRDPELDVTALLTTVSEAHDRVAMHAVRRSLLEAQAERLGIPLVVVEIPSPCPNELYEERIARAIERARTEDVHAIAFGDLFLEDVRHYRERMLGGTGIEPLFPLWRRPTDLLVREMIDAGIRARITCVDPRQLDRRFAGRELTAELVDELPAGVDPCGENGEFHTFVTDAPGFRRPIEVETGPVVERDGFVFADLLPVSAAAGAAA